MGKVRNNALMRGFSGAIGDDLVLRQLDKQTIFSRRGVVKKKPSEQQIVNRMRFAEAALFAASKLKQPKASLEYKIMAALQGHRTAQLAAISDFLNDPKIAGVDLKEYNGRVGDVIGITPELLYKIIAIDVQIFAADGTLLEEGKAVEHELNWKYIATVVNPMTKGTTIAFISHDRLGKTTTFSSFLKGKNG